MESYLLKTMKKMKKEAPRRFAALRTMCDELIVLLTDLAEREDGVAENFTDLEEKYEKYFLPLEAACESRYPRLMEIALDAFHFLIEHGYLRGKKYVNASAFALAAANTASASQPSSKLVSIFSGIYGGSSSTSPAPTAPTSSTNSLQSGSVSPMTSAAVAGAAPKQQSKTLMDLVIETITKCSDEYDENVQIQVIKALLTAITSLHCEVHEASLLLAVRACFHIHLISKNPTNKTTAKAAVTQMLSVVNQRMELSDARLEYASSATATPPFSPSTSTSDLATDKLSIAIPGTSNHSTVHLLSTIVEEVSEGPETQESNAVEQSEENHVDKVSTESSSIVSPPNESIDNSYVHVVATDVPVGTSSSAETKNHVEVPTTSQPENEESVLKEPTETTTATLKDSIDTKENISLAVTAERQGDERPKDSAVSAKESSLITFPSVFHKDSYLLFRALCKLSMKGLNEDSTGIENDPIALQNKILSLELLLDILTNSGPAFRNGEKFIFAIRSYLCVSLLNNCTSQVAQVVGLSLQIFVNLVQNFKEHLKSELEVFISTIFLRILESENSTYDHKYRVVEVFQIICKDPSSQIELFINYDCDLEAINLFSSIVDGFAKIAKNPSLSFANRGSVEFMSSTTKKYQQEEQHLRTMGLEGLVIIIRSLESSSGLSSSSSSSNAPASVNSMEKSMLLSSSRVGVASSSSTASSSMSSAGNVGSNVNGSEAAQSSATGTQKNSSHDDESSHDSTPISFAAVSVNMVELFDKKQRLIEEIDNGILKFNLSPKKGLSYLYELGHVEKSPVGVASFLRTYQDRLDKTTVGEYLGREREYEGGFCLKVLHEYVEMMDFEGMAFDIAIRHFLSGFRLPGEAQKIDRLMEKFAERYFIQNRETFASADMAFILAFSTIMLQTNLHNPAIKDDKRMTKEQFIKQNKGISADGELPDTVLSDIYDRIQAEPISMTNNDKQGKRIKKDEAATSSFVVFQPSTDKRKKDLFNSERKEMVKAGEAMFKQNLKRGSVFLRNASRNDDSYYVRPMFELVWPPFIGVISQILETYDDPSMIALCLSGFQLCIRLAARLDFPTARKTFLNALIKFTTLDAVKEMKTKNVQCIKLLIAIALSEGDYLEESWLQVLQAISQLARLQLFSAGSHTDDLYFSDTASVSSGDSKVSGRKQSVYPKPSQHGSNLMSFSSSTSSASSMSDPISKLFFMGPSRAETTRLVEEANAELLTTEIDPVDIDRIYLNSTNLSGESVKHFVKCLCEVSGLEIKTSSSMNSLRGKDSSMDSSTPRIFSLQKIVEVADFNMHSRSRLDWANIWNLLASHFTIVGLHENQHLAMYAIDSLKQLSIKFLQKEELSNFNFQRLFLKPFEKIMSASKSTETKDLILRCLEIMIKACASNIHSGWRSIFAIFEVAAYQEAFDIADISFDIIEQLVNYQFDLLIFDFVELMNCLVAFVSCSHTSLSLKGLDYLSICADYLADGTVSPAVNSQHTSTDTLCISWEKSGKPFNKNGVNMVDQDASVFRLWWPLLLGLSTRVADMRLHVRVKALNTLNAVLRKYGSLFSPQTWSVIFKGVLFPIIDSAKTDTDICPRYPWLKNIVGKNAQTKMLIAKNNGSINMDSWIHTMGLHVLTVCLSLYQLYKNNEKSVPLLPDLMIMLEGCICQDSEVLAKMGLQVIFELINSLVDRSDDFDEADEEEDDGGEEEEEDQGAGDVDRGKSIRAARILKLSKDHADLVCERVTKCIMKNVCLDFCPLGYLDLHSARNYDIPADIRKKVMECPVSSRCTQKESHVITVVHSNKKSRDSAAQHLKGSTENSSFVSSYGHELGTVGSVVETPYGVGHIVETLESSDYNVDTVEGVEARSRILLSWGAQLFSTETFKVRKVFENIEALSYQTTSSNSSSSSSSNSNGNGSSSGTGHNTTTIISTELLLQLEEWNQSAAAKMTSMVINLELIQKTESLMTEYFYSWQLKHHQQFLSALELCHWQGYLFNENIQLRLNLHSIGLVSLSLSKAEKFNSLPQLLEQETLSIELCLKIVFQLYFESEDSRRAKVGADLTYPVNAMTAEFFARPTIERISCTVVQRYIKMDHDLQQSSGDENSYLQFTDSLLAASLLAKFNTERWSRYKSTVTIVLNGILSFTSSQFAQNMDWIVPLMSRMITCSDAAVRAIVQSIYCNCLNPLLLARK